MGEFTAHPRPLYPVDMTIHCSGVRLIMFLRANLFGAAFRRWALAIAAALLSGRAHATPPAWWFERHVIQTTQIANDFAPVNQGQAKHMARAAIDEMDAKLIGGAGERLHAFASAWSVQGAAINDFAPLNIGQLKRLAAPFYDIFPEKMMYYDGSYPWEDINPWDDFYLANDFAPANIGQLKNLFAFSIPDQTTESAGGTATTGSSGGSESGSGSGGSGSGSGTGGSGSGSGTGGSGSGAGSEGNGSGSAGSGSGSSGSGFSPYTNDPHRTRDLPRLHYALVDLDPDNQTSDNYLSLTIDDFNNVCFCRIFGDSYATVSTWKGKITHVSQPILLKSQMILPDAPEKVLNYTLMPQGLSVRGELVGSAWVSYKVGDSGAIQLDSKVFSVDSQVTVTPTFDPISTLSDTIWQTNTSINGTIFAAAHVDNDVEYGNIPLALGDHTFDFYPAAMSPFGFMVGFAYDGGGEAYWANYAGGLPGRIEFPFDASYGLDFTAINDGGGSLR